MANGTTASLFSTLSRSKRLPSPPGTAMRVLELCRSDDTDVREITEAVTADPALSGRLLRYANSAMTGLSHEVTSVRDAVLCLGLRTVKLAALGFSLASGGESKCPGFPLKRFWTESIITAILARRFAGALNVDREEAFTAGLLTNIGRLALAHGLPEDYGSVLAAAADTRQSLLEAERTQLGTDHLQFGGKLLSHWEIPDILIQAIVHHRQPAEASEQAQPLARTIEMATTLAPTFFQSEDVSRELQVAARGVVESELKLDEESWQRVAEEVLADYWQVAEVLSIELDQTAMFDLYAEAQEEATRVGIVTQLERSRALEENKDLLKRATTDQLTGISNRAKFDERIKELVAGNNRGLGGFALLMFDIDHFKQFNDTYGHAVGDLVLKRVAQAVHQTLREVDLLSRYGGEEFAILASQTDRRGACTIAARTRKCVEDLRIEANGQALHVTISVGLALTSDYPQPPTVERIIADADRQLYLSKETGRNTWAYMDRSAAQVARTATSK